MYSKLGHTNWVYQTSFVELKFKHVMSNLLDSLQKIYGDCFTDTIWDCDINSILHDTINEYTEYYRKNNKVFLESLSTKFLNPQKKKLKLKELLQKDLLWILSKFEKGESENIYKSIDFVEISINAPLVSLHSTTDNKKHVIFFNKSMLDFINLYYSIRELLLQNNVCTNTIEKFRKIIHTDRYSDKNLCLLLFESIELLYSKNMSIESKTLTFYHEPYELCEKITAARRFLVAHELAHILLGHNSENKNEYFIQNRKLKHNNKTKNDEYDADKLARELILSSYFGKELLLHEQCELESTVDSLNAIFSMLDICERCTNWYKEDDDYPKAYLREMKSFVDITGMYQADSEKNFDVFYANHYSIVNNQLFKRIPFEFILQQYGVWFGGIIIHPTREIDNKKLTEKIGIDGAKLVTLLRQYDLIDNEKFVNISGFEKELLYIYACAIFGESYAQSYCSKVIYNDNSQSDLSIQYQLLVKTRMSIRKKWNQEKSTQI